MLGFYDLIRSEFIPTNRQDRLQVLHYLPSWQWRTWVLLSALIFAGMTVRGAYLALRKRHEVEGDLLQKLRELEEEKETTTPHLSVIVHEVLLEARFNAADVFVDAEILNDRPGTEATVRVYELRLRRNARDYVSKSALNDVSKYQTLNAQEAWENGYLQFDYSDRKPLNTDLAVQINYDRPIKANVPRRGWLHFLIRGMPEWPSLEWPTGDAVWLQPSFNEEGEVEDEGGWAEKTIWVRDTKSAESATLVVHYQGGITDPCTVRIVHSGQRKVGRIPMQKGAKMGAQAVDQE